MTIEEKLAALAGCGFSVPRHDEMGMRVEQIGFAWER